MRVARSSSFASQPIDRAVIDADGEDQQAVLPSGDESLCSLIDFYAASAHGRGRLHNAAKNLLIFKYLSWGGEWHAA
jgi:hypothetical protein